MQFGLGRYLVSSHTMHGANLVTAQNYRTVAFRRRAIVKRDARRRVSRRPPSLLCISSGPSLNRVYNVRIPTVELSLCVVGRSAAVAAIKPICQSISHRGHVVFLASDVNVGGHTVRDGRSCSRRVRKLRNFGPPSVHSSVNAAAEY